MSSTKALTHRLERLSHTLDALQQEWKQRNAKWKQFRAALGIEANAANKFQLEQQVQAEETQLNKLEHKIQQTEIDIEQLTQVLVLRSREVNEVIALHSEESPEGELEAQDLSPTVSGDADVMTRDKIDLRESQGAIVNPAAGAVITQQFGNTTNINTGGGDYVGGSLSK
ncbi:hypothetical protein JOY44_02100 [Phormidium sp. CLA17]|uniref:hypothetical protein n=1 Tax=Leptolyngbya sp. Cla-17 TaxID=2803751 RepID=UPI0014926A86|nr:hypothetical protein [Leptolyngbya sp. Cla-17]MBM0740418.1 hypothetical protein [Leptolyngbya sp. Cla-17]